MGNTTGVLFAQREQLALAECLLNTQSEVVIPSSIRTAATILTKNKDLRGTFVEYVQTGVWIESWMEQLKLGEMWDGQQLHAVLRTNQRHPVQLSSLPSSFSLDSESSKKQQDICSFRGLKSMVRFSELMIPVMVAIALPIFFQSEDCGAYFEAFERAESKEYKVRSKTLDRASSGGDDTVRSDDESSVTSISVVSGLFSDCRISIFQQDVQGCLRRQRQMAQACMLTMDSYELDSTLLEAKSSWFAQLVAFVETLPVGVTISRLDGDRPPQPTVSYANTPFAQLLGKGRSDLVGQSVVSSIVHDIDRREILRALKHRRGIARVVEHESKKHTLSIFHPVRADCSEDVVSVLAVHYDLDQLMRAEGSGVLLEELNAVTDVLRLLLCFCR